MERLIYISNGNTFSGQHTEWDVITARHMPDKCEWHQIFIHVENDKATQVTREQAQAILDRKLSPKG